MTGNHSDAPSGDSGLSRRDAIKRIAVGSAFALPVIASFDMASLGVSSAYANNPNQSPFGLPVFESADSATFEVGHRLVFATWITGNGLVDVTHTGKLPKGIVFTPLPNNYLDNNDCNATISGTPAAGTGGSYPITLAATIEPSPTKTQKFTVIVNEAPKFTSAAKKSVKVHAKATVKVVVSGYPHATITVSGKLPDGMHFAHDAAKGTATISGKPASKGVHKLKLAASNGVSPKATQTFTLTVTA